MNAKLWDGVLLLGVLCFVLGAANELRGWIYQRLL